MTKSRLKKIAKIIGIALILLFALIGLLFTGVFVAMKLHLTDVRGSVDARNQYFKSIREQIGLQQNVVSPSNADVSAWENSEEWSVLKVALASDSVAINQASVASGVPARTIVAVVMAEQLRFFTSNREAFKEFFEPLKILGNITQFSLGVAGIKEDTAIAIENHLQNTPNNPFYLGPAYEHVLDFMTNDPNTERIQRLTDESNHYYSYLYAGLFIHEIMVQWANAGFPISNRPEVLATIFNLGFGKSIPKANPQVGGAPITVNGYTYTFGGLAYEFYYSGELSNIFPYSVNSN